MFKRRIINKRSKFPRKHIESRKTLTTVRRVGVLCLYTHTYIQIRKYSKCLLTLGVCVCVCAPKTGNDEEVEDDYAYEDDSKNAHRKKKLYDFRKRVFRSYYIFARTRCGRFVGIPRSDGHT